MIKTSKRYIVALIIICLFPGLSFSESGERQFQSLISTTNNGENTQLYTAYNLFTQHGFVRAINFRVGDIIPAGTPVVIEISKADEYGAPGWESQDTDIIHFKNLDNNKTYTIEFNGRYHPGKTFYDYANLMFSKKNFKELTTGKPTEVVSAIHRSAIIEGMTKDEVILSYGYPSEHRTPNMSANTWIFWKNRFKTKKICFDTKELAVSCQKLESKDL